MTIPIFIAVNSRDLKHTGILFKDKAIGFFQLILCDGMRAVFVDLNAHISMHILDDFDCFLYPLYRYVRIRISSTDEDRSAIEIPFIFFLMDELADQTA